MKYFITLRMRARGTTLSKWSRDNGYNLNTVAQLLGGIAGTSRGYRYNGVWGPKAKQIITALKRDGFLRHERRAGSGTVGKD